MKTLFLSVSILFISFIACNKESHRKTLDSQHTVYKGKYIGNGCWPVVQILEPLDEKFKEPAWRYWDSAYYYCVTSMEVTERYQNGEPFYFTIREIGETKDIPATLSYCSFPKYMVVIEILSDTLSTNLMDEQSIR